MCSFEQIHSVQALTKESIRAPDRDVNDVLCIAVLDSGHDEHSFRAHDATGLRIVVPSFECEGAVVLSHQDRVKTHATESGRNFAKRPVAIVGPHGVDVNCNTDLARNRHRFNSWRSV
jgi:hypothetical protein